MQEEIKVANAAALKQKAAALSKNKDALTDVKAKVANG